MHEALERMDCATEKPVVSGAGAALRSGEARAVPRLARLIRSEGQEALEELKAWKREALVLTDKAKVLERAHLPERLRVTLARLEDRDKRILLHAPEAYVNLRSHNLFYRPEVQASLHYLPGLKARDACSREVLQALVDTANDGVFTVDAVEATVQAAWIQMRFSTASEICIAFLMVALQCYVSFTFRHGYPHATVCLLTMAVLHAKKSVEEVWRYISICRGGGIHAVELDDVVDLAYIALGWCAVGRQFSEPHRLEKPFMAAFSAALWLRLLYVLRGESWIGPRLLPILEALRDTHAFFVATSVCLLAAAHAYYNLELLEEPSPAYAAFLLVVRLGIFGDFDLTEWAGMTDEPGPISDYVFAHLLFYATGLGITILLMNLLIGVLGQNYELYQDRSAALFQRERAKMMLEHRTRLWPPIQWWLLWQEVPAKATLKHAKPDLRGRLRAFFIFLYAGPLIALLGPSRVSPLLIERHLRRLKCSGLILLFLFSPVILTLSSLLALTLLLCRIFFQLQLSGIFYTAAVSMGGCGFDGLVDPEESGIFLVLRKELPLEQCRSLRSELKHKLSDLETEQKETAKTLRRLEKQQKESSERLEKQLERLTGLVEQLAKPGRDSI